MSRTNKNKGSHAERFYAKVFRDLGFSKCETSRYGSRLHDDAKIDLVNIPFSVQIKAGKQKGLNPAGILISMESQIKNLFMEGDSVFSFPKLVIHRPKPYSSNYDEDIVYMTKNQYKELLKINPFFKYSGIQNRPRYLKDKETESYSFIVSMSFSEFAERIILKNFDYDSNKNTK